MTFKRFAIGLAIYILTIVFIVFVNYAINPKPKMNYNSCQNNYYQPETTDGSAPVYRSNTNSCYDDYQNKLRDYKDKSFVIVSVISLLAIVAGVLVRSVSPVSWGLIMAALSTFIWIFVSNYESIGKPYRAIVSGLVLAVLIWLAYAKLGDDKLIQGESKTDSKDLPPDHVIPPGF